MASITNSTNLITIINAFPAFGEYKGYRPIVEGHINDTFIVEYGTAEGGTLRCLLQRINTNVFKKPVELMENIVGVTAFLRNKIKENGGDPDRETLTVYPTKTGRKFFVDEDGSCWRLYNYVEDTYTVNEISGTADFKAAGEAFGGFQNLLADYPIDTLFEIIPHFHDTPSRFADFEAAVAANVSGRAHNAQPEIEFCRARKADCSVVTDLIARGEIPIRVTHNDTKLNNVLFDNATRKALCVVDLDTVMPGSALYDFGDSIRFGANTAAEDEKDLTKVSLSLDYFRAFVEGYLAAAGKSLTEKEIDLLPFSGKLLTLECGMRFLTDYLNGDTYFKIDYPDHNLVRARTQFKLVEDMEKKMDEMNAVVDEVRKTL